MRWRCEVVARGGHPRRPPRRPLPALTLGLLVVAARATALAGPADGVGLGAREQALGGSVVARPSHYAAHYNPAALPLSMDGQDDDRAAIELSYLYAHPMMYATRLGDGSPLHLASELPDTSALSLGAVADIGRPLSVDGLRFGLSITLPTSNIFGWHIHPDERPQWLFLSDRAEHLGAQLALAYRPWRWLSLGLALRVLFDAETLTTGRVTEVQVSANPDTGESDLHVGTRLGEQVRVYGHFAPAVGAMVLPADWLRIGMVYRGQSFVDDWGWTRIQGVPATGDLGYVHHFAHYFEPHTVVLAAAAELSPGLWISTDLGWRQWSAALSTNHAALGPGRFGDTLTPAVGISWRLAPPLELLAGYRFVPSPFDNLSGPTNLLDNDQHIGSFGGSLAFGRLPESDVRFTLRWGMRLALSVTRTEQKDPRHFFSDRSFLLNPGREPYRYGGSIAGGSVGLSASW